MRFPSVVTLANRAGEVLLRFPWTMAAGIVAAVTGIIATTDSAADEWGRVAMGAALGLPLTVAAATRSFSTWARWHGRSPLMRLWYATTSPQNASACER
jgi:hypothetical protein